MLYLALFEMLVVKHNYNSMFFFLYIISFLFVNNKEYEFNNIFETLLDLDFVVYFMHVMFRIVLNANL